MRTPTDNLIIKKVKALRSTAPDKIVIRLVARELGLTEDRVQRAWNLREEGVPSPTSN